MSDAEKQGNQLLEALENALHRCGLWRTESPSAEALASQQPFACDTLALEQWLQFIFIPRMRALLSQPSVSIPVMAIKPVAEMSWGAQYPDVQKVLGDLDVWSTKT